MSDGEHPRPQGVNETAPAWEPPPVLHARPVEGPIDWDAMIDRIRRRFPKTLARLAE